MKMKKILPAVLFLLLVSLSHASVHTGNFTMNFDLSTHEPGKEVKLWIPYPVSDTNQYITDISWQGDFDEAAVYTDRVNRTPMLFVRWPATAKTRKLIFSFTASREEQVTDDLPAGPAAVDPADFPLYLVATSLGPTTGGVRSLADEITADEKSIRDKARAIYDWAVDNTFRDPATRGCGIGDVNKLLDRPGGKCADISSIFVALTRAAGIPSREIFGIRTGREARQNVTSWQHCWAEFYLPGYGWVPVDPADVRKAMLKQGLELGNPEVEALREYFWGNVDAYRVKLAEGRDLRLNPPHHGPPLNYLMYPFAQVGGEHLDWLDPEDFTYLLEWTPSVND